MSLKFDTKIDTEGFEDGAESLKDIMKRLVSSIEELSRSIKNAFSGEVISGTKQEIEKVSEAIENADGSARRMEETMRNMDAVIEQLNSEAVSDLIPQEEIAAAEELKEVVDDIIPTVTEAKGAMSDIIPHEVVNKIDETENKVSELDNMFSFIKQTVRDIPTLFTMAGNSIKDAFSRGLNAIKSTGETADQSNPKIKALVDEIDRYKDAIRFMEGKGLYFGDKEYDDTYQKLVKAEQALNQYKRSLVNVDKEQKKAASSAAKLNNSLKKTKSTAIPLTKSIFKLSNMFKLMVIRMAMRAAINAIKEGFQNLAQYSNQANKDVSAIQTSVQTLKNSFATAFAPILTAVTPALQTLIGYLSEAISTLGQFCCA